jgi:hypothetical protein
MRLLANTLDTPSSIGSETNKTLFMRIKKSHENREEELRKLM